VNPDLSPLTRHASLLDGQRPERLVEVHERIGAARRRRRRSALAAGAAAVATVAAVVAVATGVGDQRGAEPANDPEDAVTRPLTYAVGDTIHYGARSIEVGEEVQFLAVTDDGVAFVREPLGSQPGDKPLWFTDGSTVERVGTTYGSPARGYAVEAFDTGSLLVVDAGNGGRPYFAVIDTSTGYFVHRDSAEFGGAHVVMLSGHDDALYWLHPADTPCDVAGDRECLRYRWVVRYDVAVDSVTRWTWAQYEEELRSRPRTILGPDRGTPPTPGTFVVDDPFFERLGRDLVALDHDGTREVTLSDARTGEPIRLQVPTGATEARRFAFSQWLDDDRFVLFAYTSSFAGGAPDGGTEVADEGDIFVCALSSGQCRLEVQGKPGTAYQMPGLD
jgi:hypothetical protein